MKVIGWIMYVVGVMMICNLTDGFWLPLVAIALLVMGCYLTGREDL